MEKFFKFAVCLLGLILLTMMCLLFGKTLYKEFKTDTTSYVDTVPTVVATTSQPVLFTDVNEAVITHEYLIGERSGESVYLDMPPEMVQSIASVLIASRGSCTINDIANEYRANRSKYDNMKHKPVEIPTNQMVQKLDTGVPKKYIPLSDSKPDSSTQTKKP